MFKQLLSLISISTLAIALSGCAGESSQSVVSSGGGSGNELEAEIDQIVGYEEIIIASYDLFMAQGMTEEVFSAGDNYILTATSSEDFRAGLFNESFDDTLELTIDDLVLFTVYSAKLMIEDDQTEITELENSVSLANENYGDFTVFFENGLITSAKSNDDSWSGEFSYQPDLVTLAKLDQQN